MLTFKAINSKLGEFEGLPNHPAVHVCTFLRIHTQNQIIMAETLPEMPTYILLREYRSQFSEFLGGFS
jgi:hypothetical protein